MNPQSNTEKEYGLPFKKMVVLDLLTSGADVKTIAEKYNLPHFNTVTTWKKELKRKFGDDLVNVLPEESSPLLKDQVEQADKRNLQLQKALQDAHLKIAALETMIEIAESEFKIPIRKKPGSRQ
jgi:transposase-like protein